MINTIVSSGRVLIAQKCRIVQMAGLEGALRMAEELWHIIRTAGIEVEPDAAPGSSDYRWRVAGGIWSQPLPSSEAALGSALRWLVQQVVSKQDVVDVNEERPPDPRYQALR
jgi:hypothetical protein